MAQSVVAPAQEGDLLDVPAARPTADVHDHLNGGGELTVQRATVEATD